MQSSPCGSTHDGTALGMPCHLPLDIISGRGMSRVTCHHLHWNEHTIRRCWAWNSIIPIGQHAQGRTTLGVSCHHRPWTAYMVRQCWVSHVIIALGMHTRSDNVGRGNAIIAFVQHTRLDDIRSWMSSLPMGSLHGRTMLHIIITLRQNIQSNYIGYGMPTLLLGSTWSNDVEHGRPLSPLDSTHHWTTSGVACHHRSLTSHAVGRHRPWHACLSLEQHTRLDDVEHPMQLSPLDRTQSKTILGIAYQTHPWTIHKDKRRRA